MGAPPGGAASDIVRAATGLAVTIDIGDAMDVHPQNKADVGRRLAQWALSAPYGLPLWHPAPCTPA